MQQQPGYGRACAALGSKVVWLKACPSASPIGHAQVLIRKWPLFGDFALIARGPIWDEAASTDTRRQATHTLIRTLRRRCRGVMITPDCGPMANATPDPLERLGLLPMMTGGMMARLALEGTEADRLARQHGKWRNRLRRAQQEDLAVRHMPMPDDINHWLLIKEEIQSQRRGYKRLPRTFSHQWRVQNGAKATRLFSVTVKGENVAGMLFLLHGKSASYHVGWSGELGRKLDAHTLLLWQASNWLADRGFQSLELGTLDTETTPGLARFKLGSGAVPVQLGATWMSAPGASTVARLFTPGRTWNTPHLKEMGRSAEALRP